MCNILYAQKFFFSPNVLTESLGERKVEKMEFILVNTHLNSAYLVLGAILSTSKMLALLILMYQPKKLSGSIVILILQMKNEVQRSL